MIVQLPAPTNETTPGVLTLHTVVGPTVQVTGRLETVVGTGVHVPPTPASIGTVSEMTWLPLVTVNACCTWGAAS